jgi:hypothetical protein
MIVCAEDKNNSNLNRALMGRFRRWIDDHSLIELPLIGRKFAWSNQREDPTYHIRFYGQNRMHSICVPGSISTHMLTSQV